MKSLFCALSFAISVFVALPSWAAISHVQSIDIVGHSSGATQSFTGLTAIGSGDALVCNYLIDNATNTITGIVAGSNTLTVLSGTAVTSLTGFTDLVFYGTNLTGSPTGITITYSGTPTATDNYLDCDEYSGTITSTTTGSDGSSATAATPGSCGATQAAGSITPGTSGDVIWSGWANGSSVSTPSVAGGSLSWTIRNNGSTDTTGITTADAIQAAAGAVNPTWTKTGNTNCAANVVAIKPAAGATVTPQRILLGVGQ